MVNEEIERKFILNRIPDINYSKVQLIQQVYICTDDKGELRVRRITAGPNADSRIHTMTYKSKGSDIRKEVEFEITEQIFTGLVAAADGKSRSIIKTRFTGTLPDSHKTVEIDEYLGGKHHGLIIAEIEYANQREMDMHSIKTSVLSDFIEEEVTYNSAYKTHNLAINNK